MTGSSGVRCRLPCHQRQPDWVNLMWIGNSVISSQRLFILLLAMLHLGSAPRRTSLNRTGNNEQLNRNEPNSFVVFIWCFSLKSCTLKWKAWNIILVINRLQIRIWPEALQTSTLTHLRSLKNPTRAYPRAYLSIHFEKASFRRKP